jgi:hypothetical protein
MSITFTEAQKRYLQRVLRADMLSREKRLLADAKRHARKTVYGGAAIIAYQAGVYGALARDMPLLLDTHMTVTPGKKQ